VGISEFLTKRFGLADVGAYYPHRVTYHASCHGLRSLGLGDGPASLLRAVRGIDLVPLKQLEQCCGFGGTFAVKNAEVSSAMLSEKTTAVLNTGAEVCTACDSRDTCRHRRRWPMSGGTALDPRTAPTFPMAASAVVGNSQLRKNVRHATEVIQRKRARVVGEMPDWEALRESGKRIREHTMRYLATYLLQFETNCIEAGGQVHWARDGAEAREIVIRIAADAIAQGSTSTTIEGHSTGEVVGAEPCADEAAPRAMRGEVLKIKSMTTEEIQLNKALEAAGIHPYETDLAELII
jgi:hypothetical protein